MKKGNVLTFYPSAEFKPAVKKSIAAGTVVWSLGTPLNASAATNPVLNKSIQDQVVDQVGQGVQERIIDAFDPLIQLLQGISYPVAILMLTTGAILIMTGQKSRGISFIKSAAIGYIVLQLTPGMMSILVQIGQEMTP